MLHTSHLLIPTHLADEIYSSQMYLHNTVKWSQMILDYHIFFIFLTGTMNERSQIDQKGMKKKSMT